MTWPELMAIGHEIDELGFDELWSNDHFLSQAAGGVGALGELDGPVFEGWSILFGWAGMTSRRGWAASCPGGAYRNSGLLVKMATALDHATDGRAVLGLGAGWFEREHRAFGFEFPAVGQRLDRLGDAAAICRGLLEVDPSPTTASGSRPSTPATIRRPSSRACRSRSAGAARSARCASSRSTPTSGTRTRTIRSRSSGGADPR